MNCFCSWNWNPSTQQSSSSTPALKVTTDQRCLYTHLSVCDLLGNIGPDLNPEKVVLGLWQRFLNASLKLCDRLKCDCVKILSGMEWICWNFATGNSSQHFNTYMISSALPDSLKVLLSVAVYLICFFIMLKECFHVWQIISFSLS